MSKVAILTDSNSGISQADADAMGVFLIPMPFMIDGKEYFEGINLEADAFFEFLKSDVEVFTSQPSPEVVLETWEKLLKDFDQVVFIPMSSGLSNTYQTARMLAEDFGDKVVVVNNQRISITQRQSVVDAKYLADQGKTAQEIGQILTDMKFDSDIYIMVDTLKYLKKGGRVTPAAAAIGEVLKIKPVLRIKGEKLDAFAKARNTKAAKTMMINAVKKSMEEFYGEVPAADSPKAPHIAVAHTSDPEAVAAWVEEVKAAFPGYDVYADPLSLSISCHIGPGSLAVAWTKKLDK